MMIEFVEVEKRPRCRICKNLTDSEQGVRFIRSDGEIVWLCAWCFVTPIDSIFYAVGKDGRELRK